MKQILTLIIISLFFINNSFSQCTPDPNFNGPNIFNLDTLDFVKPAPAEHSYLGVISVKVPEDTIIPNIPLPVKIDSAGVEDIKNLPSGFTWQTNSASNFWPGKSKGCIAIIGNPTMAQIGVDTFSVDMSAHGLGQILTFTFRFKIEIIDSVYYSIEELESKTLEVNQNNPNPFSNQTEIQYFIPFNDNINFVVYNIIGEVIYSENIQAIKGNNKIKFNSNNLPSGLYLYQIGNSEKVITRKMVIK